MSHFSGRAIIPNWRIALFRASTFTLLFIFAISIHAQSGGADSSGTGGSHIIQGRIYFPSGRRADLQVKISLESSNAGERYVFADSNGSFAFRNLGAGSYRLVIDAGKSFQLVSESVYIDGPSSLNRLRTPINPQTINVPIYLQPKTSREEASRLGVINAALVKIPKPAVELYYKGLQAAEAGEHLKAIEHLKGAIALHPEFPLALGELGEQYLLVGNADKAIEALESALRLVPEEFAPRYAYGVALVNKKEFEKADAELRLALKKNDASSNAHLYLGIALVGLRKFDPAEVEFQQAVKLTGGEGPALAHKYLGGIYWKKGRFKEAADELEKYLKLAPKATDAERTRNAIKELRSKK